MSTAWYLTLTRAAALPSGEDLLAMAKTTRMIDSSVRILCQTRRTVGYYQVFIHGGSLAAIYLSRKGRRQELEELLKVIGVCLLRAGGRLGMLRIPENAALPESEALGDLCSLRQTLNDWERGVVGWRELDLGRLLFHFVDVPVHSTGTVELKTLDIIATTYAEACSTLAERIAGSGSWLATTPPLAQVSLAD